MDTVEAISYALKQDIARINTASINTQNVNTVGFRSLLATNSNSTEREASIDKSQGAVEKSQRNLDFALTGSGFFVAKAGNDVFLTRNGQFFLDEGGYLSTKSGARVQGTNGDIHVAGNNLLLENKRLIVNENSVGNFLIMKAPDVILEKNIRGNMILINENSSLSFSNNTDIKQGFLERSNVNTAREMLTLMESSRHVQTMQKSLQAYEQIMNKAINDLGK